MITTGRSRSCMCGFRWHTWSKVNISTRGDQVLLSQDVKGLESNVSLLLLVVLDGWSFSGVLPHVLGTAGCCCFMLLVAIDFSKLCNLATPSFAIHGLGAELWCRAVHNSQFGAKLLSLLQINSYCLLVFHYIQS